MLTGLQAQDLKLLQSFLAVVDAGGFSAAQGRLGRSLSAISGDVRTLELRVGTKLCRRGRGGFELTAHGRQLVEASRHLIEAMDRFRGEMATSPESLAGPLRIAVNEGQQTDPKFVLSAALARFLDRPKNSVKLAVSIVSFERALEMLINNEVEVGFGYFQAAPAGIELVPLFKERNQVYCGQRHKLFGISDRRITAEMVRGCPFVWRGTRVRTSYHPRALVGIPIAASGMTPESRAYLLLSGHFLGYLAEHQAEPWVRAGLLRPLLPDRLGLDAVMQIAVRKNDQRPRQVRAFLADYFAVASERGMPPLGKLPNDGLKSTI